MDHLQRTDIFNLKIAILFVKEEVEIGAAAVVSEHCDSPLVEGGEGLVGASLGVAG